MILCVYAASALAQTGGAVSSTVITSGLSDTFTTIWGVAKWIMQAILVITAAIVAFKTATKGQGEEPDGRLDRSYCNSSDCNRLKFRSDNSGYAFWN